MKSHLDRGSYVGWKSKESKTFVQELAKAGDRQCFTGDAATKQNRIEQRQLVNPNFDPDLFVPGINLGDGGWNKMAARIMCNGCGSCTTEAVVEEPCCGCACIPCRYGIQPSERDDEFNIIVIHGQNLDRRDLLGNETCGLQDAQCLGSDGKAGLIQRQATRPRSINLTPKSLTICKSKVKGPVYPSYPEQGPNAPLGPQDFDAYRHTTGIIKYMHNSSQSCTNWGCFYQTEHPFEAQTISRFFNVHMQNDAAVTRDCPWTISWILSTAPWAGATLDVAKLMSFELGSKDRRDRLAVFLTDSNWMKGRLAKGNSPISQDRWKNMNAGDEQLAYLKELGMIFSYWNHPQVWNSYCDSYNAMRDVLVRFDSWYTANQGPSDLTGEWEKFNKRELRRIVHEARASAQLLQETRKPVPGFWGWWWTLKWKGLLTYFPGNILYQFDTIKLDQTCVNLQ